MKPVSPDRDYTLPGGWVLTPEQLEGKVRNAEEVYTLPTKQLFEVAEKTDDSEVARKLLTDENQLRTKLREKFHNWGQPEWQDINNIRTKGIEDIIKRLKKLTAPPLRERVKNGLQVITTRIRNLGIPGLGKKNPEK